MKETANNKPDANMCNFMIIFVISITNKNFYFEKLIFGYFFNSSRAFRLICLIAVD